MKPDIHEMIEAKDFAALKAALRRLEVHDLTETIEELQDEDHAVVFRLLPAQQAAEVFGDLPIERQEALLTTLSSEKVAAIVNDMPPDERTELLEEIPGELAKRLMGSLRGDELDIARRLLNYPADSIGRLMTPEYVAVKASWTVAMVLRHIREVCADKETVNVIYVVDDGGKLLDELTLEQIVLAEPDETTVSDLMDRNVGCLVATDDQESAIDEFKKYEAVALPVVNGAGVLVGIVTFDDVLDVAQQENTEDFQKMAGMAALEHSYFGTGHWAMLRKRLPWLVMLLVAQMLTTLTLTGFHSLAIFTVLVVFMPLINSPAGNTGSQMAGMMIRGLAVHEMEIGDWAKILSRELVRGLCMGTALAVMGYAAALIFARSLPTDPYSPHAIALSVAAALVVVVTLANLLGSMLPFFFARIGLDPAVTSGPFIASLMDVSSILIYFTVAKSLLHVTA